MRRCKTTQLIATAVGILLLGIAGTAPAAPHVVAFQGTLTGSAGTPLADGDYAMTFRVFGSGASPLWEEQQTVSVAGGVYNVLLGSGTTTVGTFDSALFAEDDRWLEVEVGGEVLLPRMKFTSVAYALHAQESDPTVDPAVKDGVSWGEITDIPPDIADGDAVGGITEELDPTVDPAVKDGVSWGEIADIPPDIADGDQGLTTELDPTVPSWVKDGPAWGELTGIPDGFKDGIDNVSSASSSGYSLDAVDGDPVDAVYVDDSGNVGIGTTTPGQKLELNNGHAWVRGVGNFDAANEYAAVYLGDALNYVSAHHGEGARLASGIGLLSVNFWGNVGVSTLAPPGKLTVNANVTDDAGTYANGLVFTNDSFMPELGAWTHAAIWSDGKVGYNGELVFGTDGDGGRNTTGITERMRIDKNGNVGIGTSTPTHKLHVNGIAQFELGGGSIALSTPGTNPGLIAYATNGNRRDITVTTDGLALTASPTSALPSITSGIFIGEDGNVGIGTTAPQERIDVNGRVRTSSLEITAGGDLSERFDITSRMAAVLPEPGMVVSVDPDNPGELTVSQTSYDRKVAGIISGAGGVNPGMLMGQHGSEVDGAYPVALTGRVYCRAETSSGPIQPGDLLTTSEVPGHAMRVTDYARAQGAILGKAMTPLETDTGLVLVLVALQ